MATTTNLPSRPARVADPCQPCPVCHGLECLCRPRFYAGQLLTEEDLNRLEDYLVKKNRLHNRYLHGWGVACGLEVVCDPCAKGVIVKPGFALSPCGDDIIVCQDSAVDICELINSCCRPETPECDPPRPRPVECDGERQWVLSVCYNEFSSRNQPSLTATCGCGSKTANCSCRGGSKSGCGCGGSTSKTGGCGCGGSGSATPTKTPGAKAPVACQPTLTCESYRFIVTPAPQETKVTRGAMVERFLACLEQFSQAVPMAPANPSVPQLRAWCCQVREALLDALTATSVVECSVYDLVQQLCPEPSQNTTPAQYLAKLTQELMAVLVRHLQACLCSALLPPCPAPALDNCVPIATITVSNTARQCKVVRICNLENRKFLTTWPNIQYWLSALPFMRQFRQALERLCCRPIPIRRLAGLKTAPPLRFKTRAASQPGNFAHVLMATMATHASEEHGGFTSMGLDLLGLRESKDAYLDEIQADEPVLTLLMQELAAPLVAAELPPGVDKLVKTAGTAEKAATVREARLRAKEIRTLKTSLDEMREQVKKQEVMIAGLTSMFKNK